MQRATRLAILTVCALLAPSSARADEPLRFKAHGFSIQPLPSKGGAQASAQVLLMAMPAEGGFAPNVNVQVQAYAEGIDAYVKLSKSQFLQLGIKLIADKKLGADAVSFEYTGPMQGRELHWFAKAFQAKGKPLIYLVTATATAEQWPSVGPTLKANVESFKLD